MYAQDRDQILSEVEPMLADLADAFDLAVSKAETVIEGNYAEANDGYLRSTLVRAGVKTQLKRDGYRLAQIANVGIEVDYDERYAVKVVRSDHGGNVPTPATLSRAAWYANQPRLSADGIDPDLFWDVKRLGLRGCEADAAVLHALGAQNDGRIHLVADWEWIEDQGIVRLAVSQPIGPWKKGEVPRLAWRSVFDRSDSEGQAFVPTDEDIDIFLDDEDDTIFGVKVG